MDLLRLIWIRLPLGRFINLPDCGLLIPSRMKVVNCFDDRIIRLIFPMTVTDYIRICTFQGELCESSPSIIFRQARAAFLCDAELYRVHLPVQRYHQHFHLALRSRMPKIQSLALDRFDSYSSVDDPEVIEWTPELRAGLLKTIHKKSDFLIGYLSYPASIPLRILVFEGFVTAAMKSVDPFLPCRAIDDLLPKIYDAVTETPYQIKELLVRRGYFAHLDISCNVKGWIFSYIQPALLERYLDDKDVRRAARTISVKVIAPTLHLSESLVERARRMLKWRDLFSSYYLCFLLILTGQNVDLTTVGRKEVFPLFTLMYRVAHPQLSRELMEQYGSSLGHTRYETTYIVYDAVNFVRVCLKEIPQGLTPEWRKLEVLVARGQLWQLYGTPIFEELTSVGKWTYFE